MSSIKYKGQTYSGSSSVEDASHVVATDISGNLTTVQALLDAGVGIVELTQAQYDALPTATKNDGRIYAITDGTSTALAEDVYYDNTNSELTSSNVQGAIDELSNVDNLITNSADGSIVSFDDGADGIPVRDLNVQLEPIQDLHGYDSPWPAGGGKNLLPIDSVFHDDNTGDIVIFDGSITGTYTLSVDTSGVTSVINPNASVCIVTVDGESRYDISFSNTSHTYSGTITKILVFSATSYTRYRGTVKFQLESGSTATAWTPYSNICPISGRDSVTVTRCGKNLLNVTATTTTMNGLTFTVNRNSDGNVESVAVSGTATALTQLRLVENFNVKGTFMLSGCPAGGSYTTYDIRTGTRIDAGESRIDFGNGTEFTISRNNNEEIPILITIRNGYTADNVVFKPMIRPATDADPTFEPYHGNTYNITCPSEAGTVYGGTLDVTQGVLTVDRALVDLGTLTWTADGNRASVFYTNSLRDSVKNDGSGICSIYEVKSKTGVNGIQNMQLSTVASYGTGYIFAKNTSYSDAATFKTAMSGVQLVYELATPQTYTLTPQQLTTLLGTNNVWSDADSISLEYATNNYVWDTLHKIDTNIQNLEAVVSSKADNNVSGTGYCKMPDGTLMVFGQSKIYPRSNSGTAAGALYQYICDTNITFSPSFNSTPYVSISKLSGNSGFIAWVSYNAAAITEVDLFSTASSLPTPTAGFIILWFAIGRWK